MKVLILGLLFPEELKYFPKDWEVIALPHPSAVPKDCFQRNVGDFNPDVILFQLFANKASIIKTWELDKIKAKKIAWFIDSHVSGCRQQEKSVQHLFDEVCVTHSLHLKHFTKTKKLRWLPCGLKAASYQPQFSYPNLQVKIVEPKYDIVFLFGDYGAQEGYTAREKITKAMEPLLKQKGLTYCFGEVRKQYVELMLGARVCLNISLANDLNIRNFEILALGQKLVTDRTPDHDKVPGLSKFCRFFDRKDKAGTIIEILQQAIQTDTNDRQERIDFAKQHCNIIRCIQMVNGEFEPIELPEFY